MLALTKEGDRLYAILKNGFFIKGKMDILCDGGCGNTACRHESGLPG
jgi:hypothetical protein